ncbi:tRNA-specific 2-thiouridylase [Desulfovibrio sulfodismutans]|uniref:tRNA-uridine 2-sulfurtransferase n=1 Tax=Desulfolutivibrio sulfodismutans TaxID=63561 RepID=A0A7K3NRC7_9BACT|nr:tRNA-specific 2-thiouridylase [Desulfolutivibrio sulfodismutans]NDY58677.1 tRNA-specific 2-thiouridylase [Desulfolutivibrio sulfodismutans]QLA10863.1 tRNA 2-thiouridine(34) synthase MnmA [Desulfolutivibrio sulfodismutans DSM 3696]
MPIAVAVSGGTDSLMALALLREAGHAVMAVHARFLPRRNDGLPDDSDRAAQGLAALCDRLGLPFFDLDVRADFEAAVIAPFVAAFASGHTPNPCSQCNPRLKFGVLAERARSLGARRLATGHYARLEVSAEGGVRLFPAADHTRDQSYFLALVPPHDLARTVFPLSGRLKSHLAAELAARGLTPPLPRESREVCFIPGDDYRAFLLSRHVALSGPGPILLADGREVGRHAGLWRHTVGQRRGLGVSFREPLYVLARDVARNALVVGVRAELDATGCQARDVNFLADAAVWPEQLLVQTCYRQRPRPARVTVVRGPDGDVLDVSFAAPAPRPAPGQTLVVRDAAGMVLAGAVLM